MKVMVAVANKPIRMEIVYLIDDEVIIEDGHIILSWSTRSAIDKMSKDKFDFIVTDYRSDLIDGREICKLVYEQSHLLETYVIALVNGKTQANLDRAKSDLKAYLSLDIGKTIEFLDIRERNIIPERLKELTDPDRRKNLAMGKVSMIPYDSLTILTFPTDGFPKLGNMKGSQGDFIRLLHNLNIWSLVENYIKINNGAIISGDFADGVPIQAEFRHIEKAIITWNSIRLRLQSEYKLDSISYAIIEGPMTKAFGKSNQRVFLGDLVKQASQLLKLAMACKLTLIAVKSSSNINGINFALRRLESAPNGILSGYEIYELQ